MFPYIILAVVLAAIAVAALWYLRSTLSRLESLRNENLTLTAGIEKARGEAQAQTAALTSALAEARETNRQLSSSLAETSARLSETREENSALNTRLELLNREMTQREIKQKEQEEILETRFKNLANDILRPNTADLRVRTRSV